MISEVAGGSYTLTASKDGYTFTPIVLEVAVSGNVSGQDFTGRLISSFTTCAAAAGIPVSECEGLVALYDSTDGDKLGHL